MRQSSTYVWICFAVIITLQCISIFSIQKTPSHNSHYEFLERQYDKIQSERDSAKNESKMYRMMYVKEKKFYEESKAKKDSLLKEVDIAILTHNESKLESIAAAIERQYNDKQKSL